METEEWKLFTRAALSEQQHLLLPLCCWDLISDSVNLPVYSQQDLQVLLA